MLKTLFGSLSNGRFEDEVICHSPTPPTPPSVMLSDVFLFCLNPGHLGEPREPGELSFPLWSWERRQSTKSGYVSGLMRAWEELVQPEASLGGCLQVSVNTQPSANRRRLGSAFTVSLSRCCPSSCALPPPQPFCKLKQGNSYRLIC